MFARTPRRICVLRLSALGDVVLAVPAVRALAQAYPGARITWITDRAFVPLLQGLPDNVALEGVDKPRGLGDYLALRQRFAGGSFDLLLAMQASFRANLIYPLIRAGVKIGFDAPRSRELHSLFINQRIPFADQHLVDGFMSFVKAAGVEHAEVEWRLKLHAAAQDWAQQATGGAPYVLINPCASKPERNWPLERSAALARHVQERLGLRAVLCGSRGEQEMAAARRIAGEVQGLINLAGQTDLPQLFALIAGARVLVSPDSGPVHIARAFEVPVVGLYAVARSQKTGPYQRMQWTIDRYAEAVREILKKDPGTVAWDTRVHDARAMQLITLAEVLEKLTAALSAPRA